MPPRLVLHLLAALAGTPSPADAARPAQASPTAVVESLLEADRAFAAAAQRTDLVTAIVSMLAPTALMPSPGVGFAEGPEAIRAALQRDSLNPTSRISWAPLRGGVSADGRHGFTFGYIHTTRADGTVMPGKYLAYWMRGSEGWRVIAYKRSRRPEGDVSREMLAPAVPAALVAPVDDAAALARHRESLAQAERDFSAEAQVIGLGPAFEKYGSADAMNIGGPDSPAFVLGNVAIGRAIGAGSAPGTSPVTWGPDHRVIVASSGDLGVTFGFIVPKAGGAAGRGSPFFTIWRRADARAPWRYVAE